MVLQGMIANDVIVHQRVTLGTEVPWLFLGIVRSVFETRQLVLEVEHVVSLFVAESAILVLGKHIDELLLLGLASLLFTGPISVNLRDRIVTCLHGLHHFVGNLQVWVGFTLELGFLCNVVAYVFAPGVIIVIAGEEHLVRRCLHDLLLLSGELDCHYEFQFLVDLIFEFSKSIF